MGRIINKQAVQEIAREINSEAEAKLSRPVESAQLAERTATLKQLTEPLLDRVKRLHAEIAEINRDLKTWRADLASAGLSYVDYSRVLRAKVTDKCFLIMLEDRVANPEQWAKAAINSAD